MEVQQNVVNVVDPQAGVMQQRRDVLVRAPRRDGGVDVLLARTVKTVRLVSVHILIFIIIVLKIFSVLHTSAVCCIFAV